MQLRTAFTMAEGKPALQGSSQDFNHDALYARALIQSIGEQKRRPTIARRSETAAYIEQRAHEILSEWEAGRVGVAPRGSVIPNSGIAVGGPRAFAIVYEEAHVEPVIEALCRATGDDSEDYTATKLGDNPRARAVT